jgi:4'-phosphopantetheinyl transferase
MSELEYALLYKGSFDERKSKADRYKDINDKKRCIVAGVLLDFAIRQKYFENVSNAGDFGNNAIKKSTLDNFRISKNKYGKPFIEGDFRFEFNISHSGKWVVIAYGETPVGVDVEKIRHDEEIKKLACRYFTENEIEYVFETENDFYLRFTEIWTGKESYLKYKGVGIGNGLKTVDVTVLKEKGLFCKQLDDEHYLSCFSDDNEYSIKFVSASEVVEI